MFVASSSYCRYLSFVVIVASLAGAGTLTLEFELLSRLTGDQSFGKSAKLATRALWVRGSAHLHLYGKHINAQSGQWAEQLSGIGSNSDSFYEYLAKHYLLFPDDSDFWTMFVNAYSGVHGHSRLGEWYVDGKLRAACTVVVSSLSSYQSTVESHSHQSDQLQLVTQLHFKSRYELWLEW